MIRPLACCDDHSRKAAPNHALQSNFHSHACCCLLHDASLPPCGGCYPPPRPFSRTGRNTRVCVAITECRPTEVYSKRPVCSHPATYRANILCPHCASLGAGEEVRRLRSHAHAAKGPRRHLLSPRWGRESASAHHVHVACSAGALLLLTSGVANALPRGLRLEPCGTTRSEAGVRPDRQGLVGDDACRSARNCMPNHGQGTGEAEYRVCSWLVFGGQARSPSSATVAHAVRGLRPETIPCWQRVHTSGCLMCCPRHLSMRMLHCGMQLMCPK